MKNKKLLVTTCFALILSVPMIGCSPAERPVPQTTPNQQNMNNNNGIRGTDIPTVDETLPRTDGTNPNTNNRTTTDNNTTNNIRNNTTMDNRTNTGNTMRNTTNNELTDRADRIANAVQKLDEVESATVVITENTALVGIDMTSGTKGNLNAQIKREVENAVKKADKDIDRVSVTADPDLFTRIENIARDIGQGRPLSGFGKEVEEIIRRITPGA